MRIYIHGWYKVGFERELTEDVSPTRIGATRLILVKTGGTLRAFGADCPHRGAHLGLGGKLLDGSIVCPFHGYRIALGAARGSPFSVPEFPILTAGGMVFVRLSAGRDNGWSDYIRRLEEENVIVNGFEMRVRSAMDTATENAVDQQHFPEVHGVGCGKFSATWGESGELIVESLFSVTRRVDKAGPQAGLGSETVPYRAVVVSPGLMAGHLAGSMPYTVIAGATDQGDATCMIRISLAFPRSCYGPDPVPAVYGPLLEYTRRGLEQDRLIWENLAESVVPNWTVDDHSVKEFGRYCESFRAD